MTSAAWAIFAVVWWATLTAFRRDAAWDLLIEGMIFLVAAAGFARAGCLRVWPLALASTAIAALAVAQLAAGETISPTATALAGMRWLALAAWCLTIQCKLRASGRRFLEITIHAAGAFALLSLLMEFTSGGRVYWYWPTPQAEVLGPWVNRNHFAVWCELLLAPAVWLATDQRRFWWAAVALLAGGAASGSRAGIGLLLMELVLLMLLLGWHRRDLWPSRANLLMAVITLPLLAGALAGDDVWRKLRDPEPFLYRDQMWRSALTLIADRPWTGHGLGTFELAYPAAATFDTGELVDHAHNDWLEWGVGGGVPLMALMVCGYLYTVGLTRTIPWLLGVPIAGLHALVDYPSARLPFCLWAMLLITLAGLQHPRFKMRLPPVRSRMSADNTRKRGWSSPHRIPGKELNLR